MIATLLTRVRYGAVIAIGVVVAVLPLLTGDRYLIGKVLVFVALNLIIVSGLALVFGFAGQISLGHAAFCGLGAYTTGFLVTTLDWPPLLGVVAAVLISGLGGLALALPSLRLKGHYLAMATLGFNEIMSVLFVEMDAVTGGNNGLSGIPYFSVAGARFDTPALNYWLVWGVAAVVLALAYNIVRGRPGRAMRALHGSEIGALASGVDTTRLKVQVFGLSAAFAGLAGALYAHSVGFVSPTTFSLETSVILVAMVVIGGSGSLAGPVMAAVVLTLVPYADALVPGLSADTVALMQDWEADVYGILMIGVIILAPGGLGRLLVSRRDRRVAEAGEAA
ncbi:MAG: branched-chain amino acid ABC transporter permease [Anaerosomatales bacterium]|nr:branched-chain amino acid ABC transporter permease [Anaerosomatales bacterium]